MAAPPRRSGPRTPATPGDRRAPERRDHARAGPLERRIVAAEPRIAHRPAPAPPQPSGVRVVTGPMFIDTARGQFVDRSPPPPPIMSRREFEQEYQRLLRAFAQQEENPGSVSCTGCRRCFGCMFCRDCEECYRCTHSSGCRTSSHLTHCVDCTGCHDCAYCVDSENCTRSSYLVLCRSCSECTYCFGSVGLAKSDFHILNVKYGRTEYFRIMKALKQELGLPD